ncbi:MAG TPA: P-II family nitrogen regulator [Pyrinomonadaceae bacterium]|nr:P-II family nitrogen regulator [Pyrinomonadaceae bacterium]
MKLIIAVIRPSIIDKIVAGLEEIEDFPGVTVSDVQGFGRPGDGGFSLAADPMRAGKQLMIAANDDLAPLIVAELCRTAHTGRRGDGIILTLPIDSGFHL